MATLEELVVQLVAETSQLKAEMSGAAKAVQTNTDKMDKAVAEFSKNSSKNASLFEQAMATMAGFLGSQVVLGAFEKLKEGAALIAGEFMKGVEAANAEELALTKLANSMALNGTYTAAAAKDLQAFASEMERTTNVGDDVIANNLSILSSLTKLESEGLKTAQKAALDLSVAVGMDLEGATRLIAKGINGNVEAFNRYGIKVEEGATKSERLSNIMTALAGTSGAAEGATKTFDGQLGRISNTWGNITEAVATSITKNKAAINVLDAVGGMLLGLEAGANSSGKAMQLGVAKAMIAILDIGTSVIAMVDALLSAFKFLYNGTMAIFMAMGGSILSILGLAFDGAEKAAEDFWAQFRDNATEANKAIAGDTTLGALNDNLLDLKAAAMAGYNEMKTGAESTIKPNVDAANAAKGVTTELTAQQEAMKAAVESLAEQGASMQAAYDFQLAMLKANKEQGLITEEEYAAAIAENAAAQFAEEQANLEASYAQKLINDEEYANARIALARKAALGQIESEKMLTMAKAEEDKLRQRNFGSTLNTISSLAQSGNRELAAIGKAAAITQATIDGYAAVQKALASAPPPFNFALAGLVGAATAANVAKISGVALAEGGIVRARPGGIQATIGEGGRDEAVIPLNDPRTASRLSGIMGGGGGPTEIVITLKDGLMDFIETQLVERGRLGQSLQVVT